jgi:hypothetical protein
MLALQFATATANLASQNAFLFLATVYTTPGHCQWHGQIFIRVASSSSATLIQCGFQYRRWSCSPIPPLVFYSGAPNIKTRTALGIKTRSAGGPAAAGN